MVNLQFFVFLKKKKKPTNYNIFLPIESPLRVVLLFYPSQEFINPTTPPMVISPASPHHPLGGTTFLSILHRQSFPLFLSTPRVVFHELLLYLFFFEALPPPVKLCQYTYFFFDCSTYMVFHKWWHNTHFNYCLNLGLPKYYYNPTQAKQVANINSFSGKACGAWQRCTYLQLIYC